MLVKLYKQFLLIRCQLLVVVRPCREILLYCAICICMLYFLYAEKGVAWCTIGSNKLHIHTFHREDSTIRRSVDQHRQVASLSTNIFTYLSMNVNQKPGTSLVFVVADK